jgi:hypothetical protein
MDAEMARDHLAQAERHIAQGERHIADQREIIAELGAGRPRHSAGTLAQFEEIQAMQVAERIDYAAS